jgi:uncharacterized cupredoxin-like copper-binding protein
MAALAIVPLTAACGGSSGSSNTPSGTADVTVIATDSRFDAKTYTAKANAAGEVSFEYVGKGSLVHTLLVDKVSGFKLQVSNGKKATGKVALAPGTYTIYCDIPGHRAQGMEATLTVT